MRENRIITSPLHTFYHQKSLVFYFRMQTGQLKLFLYVATPPSHLQCSQYYGTFSVHDSCRRKLILAPSGGVGRCHRTVLTHVTELGWVRPMGEQHKCWARLIAGSKQFRFFSVILMKYFPATKLVWLMSCSTYEARNVHNSKHTHCCRCLSSKIITGEQRKSFQTIS